MADHIIRAEAILGAKDATGGAFASAAAKAEALVRKLNDVGKASGIAQAIERENAALRKQAEALAAIDRYRNARRAVDPLKAELAAKQRAVTEAARAMRMAEAPTAKLTMAYTKAVAAARQADKVFQAQNRELLASRTALSQAGVEVGHLAESQSRLKREMAGSNAELERQTRLASEAAMAEQRLAQIEQRRAAEEARLARQERVHAQAVRAERADLLHRRHRFGEGLGVGHLAASGGGVYLAGHVVRSAAEQIGELQHELVRMETSGMSPEEIGEAKKEAMRLSGEYRAFSPTEVLHMLRNTRSIVGNYHEAAEVADPLLQLRTVALGAHPEHAAELEADFDKLVKGMEIKGVTQDLPAFRRYMQGMAKAVNVFGDTLRPTDYYEMFKYGRQSTNATSEDFMLAVALTLAQELGGSSAGKALQNVYQHLIGGHMEHTAVQDLDKFGLIDHRKVSRTKTGAIKGVLPGGVVGTDMPGGWDFYKWINETYLPALAKRGITDPNQIQQHIATDFGTGTATQVASIFAMQQARIEKDRAMLPAAKGLEAAEDFMTKDPKVAWRQMVSQQHGFFQAAGEGLGEPGAGVMNLIAKGLHGAGSFAGNHPMLTAEAGGAAALGGGVMAYKFLAAGPMLYSAGVQLQAAARAQTGRGLLPGAGGEGPSKWGKAGDPIPGAAGAKWFGNSKIPGIGLGRSLFSALTFLPAAWDVTHANLDDVQESPERQRKVWNSSFAGTPLEDDSKAGESWLAKKLTGDGTPFGERLWNMLPSFATPSESTSDILAAHETAGRTYSSAFDLASVPNTGDYHAPAAGVGGMSDLGASIASSLHDLRATVDQPVPVDVSGKVQAELVGQANVNVTVAVTGPGQVTGTQVGSSGNLSARVGTSMAGAAGGG